MLASFFNIKGIGCLLIQSIIIGYFYSLFTHTSPSHWDYLFISNYLFSWFLVLVPWHGVNFGWDWGIRGHYSKTHIINCYVSLAYLLLRPLATFVLYLPLIFVIIIFTYANLSLLYYRFFADNSKIPLNYFSKQLH